MIRFFKALGVDTPPEEEQAADLLSKVNGHYAPDASKVKDDSLSAILLVFWPMTVL